MSRTFFIVLPLAAGLLLAACGNKGPLVYSQAQLERGPTPAASIALPPAAEDDL